MLGIIGGIAFAAIAGTATVLYYWIKYIFTGRI